MSISDLQARTDAQDAAYHDPTQTAHILASALSDGAAPELVKSYAAQYRAQRQTWRRTFDALDRALGTSEADRKDAS